MASTFERPDVTASFNWAIDWFTELPQDPLSGKIRRVELRNRENRSEPPPDEFRES